MFPVSKYPRLLTAFTAVLALVVAGCSGSQSTVPPAGGSLPQSAAQKPATLLDEHHHEGRDYHIVATLQLDVANGNASWSLRHCSHGHDWHDKDWDQGSVYTPDAGETLTVAAFSLENSCRHHADGDDHAGADRDDADSYYVMMATLPDLSFAAVAGPGQRSGDDIAFPAANAPLALSAGQHYVFVLVRSDDAIPTPTPAATATPTPCVGKNCQLPPPTPVPTQTPSPVPTATPTPCVGKNCQLPPTPIPTQTP